MNLIIPTEKIENQIYLIRKKKVMLDRDLANLYGVETKRLKEQVKRNKERFPKDFMFDLSRKELTDLRSQIATSSWGGTRYIPMAFTEHGILMLSSVLKSKRAIQVNIEVIRSFVKLRELASNYEKLSKKLKELESKSDKQFKIVFDVYRRLKEQEINEDNVIEGFKP